MKSFYLICLGLLCQFPWVNDLKAEIYMVNSQASFDNAHDNASANDSIIWESGSFQDIYMLVDKNDLFIAAKELGETVFNGDSKVRLNGDHITLEGFQFVGGDNHTTIVGII